MGETMSKLLLVLMLTLVSVCAKAEWSKLGVSVNGDTTIYTNIASIRKVGDKVKMWDLKDNNTIQTSGADKYLSSKTFIEYDCKEEQSRVLSFSLFSENMGGGNVLYSDSDVHNWVPVQPDSVGEVLWKVACSKQ